MAAEAKNTSGDWKKRESFGMAMAQIAAVALVLAGAVYFFYQRNTTKKEVSSKLEAARATALRDNPDDLQKAVKQLDEVFAIDANAPEALATAAAIHTNLWLNHKVPGADAKAKDFLARAEKADAKGEDRYGTKGLHILAEGKPHEAWEYIEELRKKGASKPKLFYVQGLAMRAEGNLKLGRAALASAMDKAWKDPLYACALGDATLEEGLFNQSNDAYNKALSANPDHLRARLSTGMVRVFKKDRVKEAESLANEVAARDAELSPALKARVHVIKGEVLNQEGKFDEAIASADRALTSNPDDAWALFVKARALGLKKDPNTAAAFDAVFAKGKTVPVFYFEGASLLQQAGSLDAAIALLDKYEGVFKAVKVPTSDGKEEAYLDRDDRYWLARGDVFKAAGKIDEAMAAYDKAIAAKSLAQVKAYYAKASIYLDKKEWDKAQELLQDITPNDGTGQLAEAYVGAGDIQFAKSEWAAGAQLYAFALTRMKTLQVPREQMNALLTDVEKKLIAAKQKETAKAWKEEASKLIQ